MRIAILFILLLILVVVIRKGTAQKGGSGVSAHTLFRTRRNSRPELDPSYFKQQAAPSTVPEPEPVDPLPASDGVPTIPTMNGYGVLRVMEATTGREHIESFFDAGQSTRFHERGAGMSVRFFGCDGTDILFTDCSSICYRLQTEDCHLRLQDGLLANAYRYFYNEENDTLLCQGPTTQRHTVYGVRKMLLKSDMPVDRQERL